MTDAFEARLRSYWVQCPDCAVLLSLGTPHRNDRLLLRDGFGHMMRDDKRPICEPVVGGDE